MAKVNYEKEWNMLKQWIITDYITLRNTDENGDNIETLRGEILRLEKIGEKMDWRDDTCEFENLIHDMNMEDK